MRPFTAPLAASFALMLCVSRPSAAPVGRLDQDPRARRVPILVYHSVAPHHPGQTPEQRLLDVDTAIFAGQMRYLAEQDYRVIPLARLVGALEGTDSLPERAVVITLDDGWANQYRHAFPVLERFRYPATFFVYADPIGHDARWMTWTQLRELQEAGMSIQSHTRSHPDLTSPNVALADELEGSRREIARRLGRAPEFLAYPFGSWDKRVVEAVRAAGYRAARTYPGGAWNGPADLFALHSVTVTDDMVAFAKVLPAREPALLR